MGRAAATGRSSLERGTSPGDLHCHSTASDGTLAPAEVVDLAASRGVRVLALTDHDTTAGLAEARTSAARHAGFLLVPGVEISCEVPRTEVHLVGLFIDPEDARFQEWLRSMREDRVERGAKIVAALERLGAPVSWARVQAIAGEASIGRPHVARALVEAGHVASIEEAFDRFLEHGAPAYVERRRLPPAEAIARVRDAGGLPVFAHPPFTRDHERIAEELASAGLFGIEVYYRDYPPEQIDELRRLADRLGLFASGGSDFHSFDRVGERTPGEIPLPAEQLDRLFELARDAGCRIPAPDRA